MMKMVSALASTATAWSMVFSSTLCRIFASEALEAVTKPSKMARWPWPLLGPGMQRRQPLVIGGIALAQPLAKHRLQRGETVEAEMMGEPDQGRGLHAGGFGDAGGGAEGDVVGVVERILRDLGDALRQRLAPLQDQCAQPLEIARQLRLSP